MFIFTINILTLRKFFKILARIFLAIVLLVLILYGLLHSATVQTWLVKKVAYNLSQKLKTKVTVQQVDFRFFNKIILKGLMVEDLKQDTLLYAGIAKANVNDWFFIKDKISIENVGLEDAYVNMYRKDTVWNYQFIVDYFAKPTSTKKDSGSINIDFKEVHFTNILFKKNDGWIGQDMIAKLGQLDVLMDLLDIKNKKVYINKVNIESPYFAQNEYEGNRPPIVTVQAIVEKIPVLSAFKWNNGGWQVKLQQLFIKNGTFKNDKQTEEPAYTDRFDGKHLYFNEINGSLKNVLFLNDTLTTFIDLKANERSGLQIKQLASNLKLTPVMMEFSKLNLLTNNSHLQDYYSMNFESFGDDFSRFIHNVTLQASFKNSTLSSKDLAFFAPTLKKWNRSFAIEGDVKGPIDNFSAKNMKIRSGNTYLEGSIAMRGLPDINSTFIDFQSKRLSTNYAELVSIIPQIKKIQQPAISKLGAISFNDGSFTGFIKDFVAYGTFNTALGSLKADVNMKVPENKPPAYSGSIATNNFKIGAFLNNNKLNNVGLNIKVVGQGFNLNELKATVNGTVSNVDFSDYNYKNITLNGDFEKKLFKGHASINDPNLSVSSFDGSINFLEKNPGFKLKAIIEKADLNNLKLTSQEFAFSGNVDVDFSGSNIDNFLGTAKISNASLKQNGKQLSFDSLTINANQLNNGQKTLTLQSNEIDANITGFFNIGEIPSAVKILLAKYYPTYIKAPINRVNTQQNFTFNIKTYNVDQYIQLIDKKLTGFNNATFAGNFNLQSNNVGFSALIPQFAYDGKIFYNTNAVANGNKDTLVANIAIKDIVINDSLHLPNSNLQLTANNDISLIKLNTSASQIFGNAELNASIQTLSDGVKIHFYPSSFIINNKKWQLDKDGELTLRKRFLDASEVKFFEGNQAITFSTELDTENDNTNLIATLQNVSLSDFAFLLPKKPGLSGYVTGQATAKNIFGNQTITFVGKADSFALDGRYLGTVNVNATANTTTGNIAYDIKTDEADFKFALNGKYNYKDSLGNGLDINIKAQKLNIDILKPYLKTVFSDVSGIAIGDINIRSTNGNLTLIGETVISNGSFKIGYTQVRYNFDNQKIIFGRNVMDIGTIQIKDTLGNTGTVSGKMYHEFFQNFNFENIRFTTPKMLLLNTTKKDNAQFYGQVIGRGNMSLDGGIANMKMNIDGEPSFTDSSHIYLPTGNTKENNEIDYIDFIQFGSVMDKDVSTKEETNLSVNLDLKANPACKIDVILDEETGDIIKGQGYGNLNIKVGTKEPLTIRGRYDLTGGGKYTFNFQTIFNKPFELNSGSIVWSGDPFLANLNIDASYLAKNVDISSLNFASGTRQQEDINIFAHITGTLLKPTINFEFKLPENSEYTRDFYIVKKLADFKNDENEMSKQVASLILLNQFISNTEAINTGQSTLTVAAGTIGGVISSWLTSTLNNVLQKLTNGVVSAYIDVNPSLNYQQANQLQANIRSKLRFKITKDLLFYAGGNIDYNNPFTQLYNKSIFTPDFSLEWLINKDGSLRITAFNRTTFDNTNGQRNRSGVQFGYRKEIDRLGDIFRTKKRIEELDSIKYNK